MSAKNLTGAEPMPSAQHVFKPDYALSPGRLLEEVIQQMEISARELARRCGRSAKLMTEIIAGKAVLEPETALQLERVLDIDATIWLNMEAEYRLHLARLRDDTSLAEEMAWANSFPTGELVSRRSIPKPKDKADTVRQLLSFFGVANVKACEEYFSSMAVSYRHSPSFDSNKNSLFVWLRMGELEAESIQCKDYDRSKFIEALDEVRKLTLRSVDEFMPAIKEIFADAGVAFVITRPLPGIALSGVSRWLTPRKALIQQTMRHLANDHFWFTLFHEAAHILHHSRKTVFVDGRSIDSLTSQEEDEANTWAAKFLIDQSALDDFIEDGNFTEQAVRKFAKQQEIAPGIVVGQLQKRDEISYNQLNGLKERYQWNDGE